MFFFPKNWIENMQRHKHNTEAIRDLEPLGLLSSVLLHDKEAEILKS